MSTKAQWQGGKLRFYDGYEAVKPLSPVVFEDDFLGYKLGKYIASENTTARWGTVETNLNTAIALAASIANGAVDIILDSDDNAEVGVLHFGDQLPFSLLQGLIFECRLTFPVLPLTGTETVQAVFGLASAHNTTLDSVGTNAWFRVESAANTALLWETDIPGGTDDDDNATGITLVAGTYHYFRIDCSDGLTAKFYVDNVLVGTGDIATGMSAGSDDLVQPYFNVSKAKSSANTGIGTMRIDYVRCWQNRS